MCANFLCEFTQDSRKSEKKVPHQKCIFVDQIIFRALCVCVGRVVVMTIWEIRFDFSHSSKPASRDLSSDLCRVEHLILILNLERVCDAF